MIKSDISEMLATVEGHFVHEAYKVFQSRPVDFEEDGRPKHDDVSVSSLSFIL